VRALRDTAHAAGHGHQGAEVTTWGGQAVQHGGKFHMFVSEYVGHCGITSWLTNNQTVRFVADTPKGRGHARMSSAACLEHLPVENPVCHFQVNVTHTLALAHTAPTNPPYYLHLLRCAAGTSTSVASTASATDAPS
jgi:hypothetical protein